MNYEELVKALRCCGEYAFCNDCPIFETCDGDVDKAMAIAADAIEALQAQLPKRGEIVRCRECKWYEADLYANPWGVCFHEDWVANNIGHTVDEDGFCYRGEMEVQE